MIALALVLVIALGCGKKAKTQEDPVERGKYLVMLGGCNDCHTPKIPGPGGAPVPVTSKLLSGHPENSPAPTWSPDDMKQKMWWLPPIVR